MKIKDKIWLDREGLTKHGPINIVIFGDSVSHGSFLYYHDYENVYWNLLRRKLNALCNYMPVNMICAAIGGTTAKASVERIEKQVLNHNPDTVIICFGLNDINNPLEDYIDALRTIFTRCLDAGCEVVFMTPNMLNTYVAEDTPPQLVNYAAKTARIQLDGTMDRYMEAAICLATEMGVTLCDCYSKWKDISKSHDTTKLLINRINHPTAEMHQLFADSLYEVLIGNESKKPATDDGMFRSR